MEEFLNILVSLNVNFMSDSDKIHDDQFQRKKPLHTGKITPLNNFPVALKSHGLKIRTQWDFFTVIKLGQ